MKLLVTGIEPPNQIATWSGIPYHLTHALGKSFELCFVGGLEGPQALLHKYIEKFHRHLKMPGSYRVRSEPSVLKEFVGRLEGTIRREKPDAVLTINSEPIAYLPPGLPVFLIHDATFKLLLEDYPNFQILSKRSQITGEQVQRRAVARATMIFSASEWARKSVCVDYGIPESRVKVIPMGANLLDPPNLQEVEEAIDARLTSSTVHFLFVGVEWERKGGDTAVSIVQSLIDRGLKAKLDLVGCHPPPEVLAKPFVISHGFLSKQNVTESARLRTLFQTAHFFIMPSVAECFGCVFCEATAFGVPNIARAVGGISEVVKNEVTGFLLSRDLPETHLIDLVWDLAQNPGQYQQMALRARADYEARLNWDVYARDLKETIEAVLSNGEGGAP